ncbi:Manganese transport system membrane protein MntB [Rubripirellula amarantea]|uniref:Manganese transport system membrane protein MntB n=1 Tax=Rubripirellula amarantea TaxID=2527999 RepID=A0A5C5WVC9_9BACT|nr:iron chelate uptake ABC transporter family permease subunit [Rubripirellula amarantea]TWT54081.1 Manganese transport system membrane protein MntB [Rubripirellula amarantea]
MGSRWAMLAGLAVLVAVSKGSAQDLGVVGESAFDQTSAWPTLSQWWRVISLQDYNTRIVVLGVAVLGASAGLVGSFTLLRKRALMGDALSHASLPGIGLAFMIATWFGRDGKSIGYLLAGATISGLLGVATILWIRNRTRLKEDAALGIVLSVFFGAGVAILSLIQQMEVGHAAGLEGFIYGKTASMRSSDVALISVASLIAISVCLLNFKELKLLCFDEGFAGSRGYPVVLLDVLLMSMVVLVTIVGLQAVGLILVIALMVIPAAAARFWTDSLWRMTAYSAVLGMVGCVSGAIISAVFPNLPSGAMIVLVCAVFFFLSMMFGTSRGVLIRTIRRRRLNRRIERQHLLRAMYERLAPSERNDSIAAKTPVAFDSLLDLRSWSRQRLHKIIRRAEDDELVRMRFPTSKSVQAEILLTRAGYIEGARLTRQHRLWELYLIAYAEVAPGLVDRDADDIEHVLAPEIVDKLEDLLEEEQMRIPVPDCPHEMSSSEAAHTTTGSERA